SWSGFLFHSSTSIAPAPGEWPGMTNPRRSNEEILARSQIKTTRRVPQVRSLNLGLGVAFLFTLPRQSPPARGEWPGTTNPLRLNRKLSPTHKQNNTEGAPGSQFEP